MPKNIFITGCNRGLGLELVKQFLNDENPPQHLFATCRDLAKAQELTSLAEKYPNLHVLTLDITKHEQFDGIINEVSRVVGDDGLNLLFNNSGVLLDKHHEDFTTAQRMRDAFEVNTIGPYFLTKAFIPLLQKANVKAKANGVPVGVERSAIIMMSSCIASVSDCTSSWLLSTRFSKAALNMTCRTLHCELKAEGIMIIAMSPGWVKTDLGGPNAPLESPDVCGTMVKTLKSLTEKDDGSYIEYDKKVLPW